MLIIKDGKKEGSKDKTHTHTISLSLSLTHTHTHTHTAEMLNAPLSRDGISDICGHMIREDFYYKITAQHPPLSLSLTEAYSTTTCILEEHSFTTHSRAPNL